MRKNTSFKFVRLIFFFLAFACSNQSNNSKTGRFVDSPVDGLEYIINGRQGVTVQGYFEFFEGETVRFSVGGVPIGNATLSLDILTPIDIGPPENTFPDHQIVLNIARFLQSVDMDGIPANGITISEKFRQSVEKSGSFAIHFDVAPETFEKDTTVLNMLEILETVTPDWRPDTNYEIGNFVRVSKGGGAGDRIFKVIQATKKKRSGDIPPDWDTPDVEGQITDNDIIWEASQRTLVSKKSALSHFYRTLSDHKSSNVVFINLGDSYAAGTQSGPMLLHQQTQEKAYANILAEKFKIAANTTWGQPLIDFELLKNGSDSPLTLDYAGTRLNPDTFPCNLGICNQTLSDMRYEKSMDNPLAEALYYYTGNEHEILADLQALTQTEAAKYVASVFPDKQKIITFWGGMTDIFSLIYENHGASLGREAIDTVYGDTDNFEKHFNEIIEDLSEIDHSRIFVCNIPDLRHLGCLFKRSDIEAFIRIPDGYGGNENELKKIDDAIMTDGEHIGLKPFIDEIAPYLSLEKDFSKNLIYQAISQVKENNDFFLDDAESAIITAYIEEINHYIGHVAEICENVYLVDMNSFFKNLDVTITPLVTGDAVSIQCRYGGGFYSLDGYSPSDTGYLLIASVFIKAINDANVGITLTEIDNDDIVAAWQKDPYRDADQDGYAGSPDDTTLISPYYRRMTDCDDNDGEIFAPFSYFFPKDTCP